MISCVSGISYGSASIHRHRSLMGPRSEELQTQGKPMNKMNLLGTLVLRNTIALVFMAGFFGFSMPAFAEPATADTARVNTSKHYQGRDAATATREARDEFDALVMQGDRARPSRKDRSGTPISAKASANASRTPNTDFWFFLTDVRLFADDDRDGYYSGIDLLFDVDSYFASADVYAVAYLSFESGPWNEYTSTDNFTVYGASDIDEYSIVTDLVSGYPRGSYDLLVEVFDAYNDELLAYFGPEDTSEFALLPLEDMDRDAPVDGGQTVIVESGGGGSADWAFLLMTGFCALYLLCRRQKLMRSPSRVSP